MIYAYFEIGYRIVEEEQGGAGRAAYGKYLLEELSDYLTDEFGKGYSVDNLKLMRKFYMVYSGDQLDESVLPQSKGKKIHLIWRVISLIRRNARDILGLNRKIA